MDNFFLLYSVFIFTIEKTALKRSRFVFTIGLMVLIFTTIITVFSELFIIFRSVTYGTLGLIVPIFFSTITRKSKLEHKHLNAFILAVLVFGALSIPLLEDGFKSLNFIPLILPHVFIIIGFAFAITPNLTNPSRFPNGKIVWIRIMVLIIIYETFIVILYILVGNRI